MINEIEIEESDNIEVKLLELKGVPKKSYEQKTYGFFSKDSIKKGIEKMIDKLGFRNKERITKAYLALGVDYKDKT